MLNRRKTQLARLQSRGRADLIQTFNEPLAYMSADEIKRLRIKGIRLAVTYTLVGAALCGLSVWASSGGYASHSGNRGMGALLFVGLFCYGIYRLFTIKRWMIQDRRDLIATADTMKRRKK